MSRPEHGRGARPIKGLAVVFGLLVFFVLYVAWRDSIPLTAIPVQLLNAPLWFYVVLVIAGAAFVAAMRAREEASSPLTPSDAGTAEEPVDAGTPDDTPETMPEGPISTSDRVLPEFAPVARSYPWEGQDNAPRAPPAGEPSPIPELDSTPDSSGAPSADTAVGASARPETLLNRLMNWLDATSPDSMSKRFSR
ncbi:MAG: hypothetical protein E6K13_05580 [Methanobacteriota archaeon]|nr:MAG: hypothetical protein E6K13_05580 [Euryarchaeota archaeon]